MIVLHNLGALVECISEPWYNMAGVDGLVHVRLHAEALGLIARAVVTFICITHYDQGILAFGIAQLVYGVVYTIALIALSYISRKSRGNDDRNDVIENSGTKFIPISVFVKRSNNFLPRLLYYPSSRSVSHLWSFMLDNLGGRSLLLAAAMTGTVIMNHISTEADKIILSIYVSYYNQGIYSVANNYCSLVARLVFFPIEEACRLTFPRMVGDITRLVRRAHAQKEGIFKFIGTCQCSDVDVNSEIGCKLRDMYSLLLALLQLVSVVGVMFSIFGPFYARAFVNLVLGPRWYSEDIINTISSFCFYILIMGLNGVSEAFCQSVVLKRHMYILTIGLCCCSIISVVSVSAFIDSMGTTGIVLSIAASMFVRLLFNLSYIYASYQAPAVYIVDSPSPSPSPSPSSSSSSSRCDDKNENEYQIRTLPLGKENYFIPMNIITTVVVVIAVLHQSSTLTYEQEIAFFTWSSTSSLLHREIMHIGAGCLCLLALFAHMYLFKKREICSLFKRISATRM